MASTTKITLSVDAVALSLAQRAAEMDGVSVSAVVSKVLRRHLINDYGPISQFDTVREEGQAADDLDLVEQAERVDGDWQRRAAG